MLRLGNATVGMLLLALICLASSAWQLRKAVVTPRIEFSSASQPGPFHGDFVRVQERLGPLQAILPQQGFVGYISDSAPPRDRIERDCPLAQYTLVPLIVMKGTDYPYVIGDFHRLGPDLKGQQMRGLALVKNFGNGVMLFRSDAR